MNKKKIFLYATEFVSGMSVMAVELGASRLLAPYFSSSQIIWTIIIGTIMIAMALGNVWGGRMADKKPNPDFLYGRIALAGVWIALIPVLGRYVIAGISLLLALFVESGFLVWASLLSCLVLFVFPLMLLGSVSPALVKFSVSALNENGRTVGELNALNTIGSILGTFLPTFVTIPAVGTLLTFVIFAALLLAVSGVYFIGFRKKWRKTVISAVLVLVCGVSSVFSSFSFWEDTTYEGESIYNYLKVYEDDSAVYFSTNVLFGVQSMKMKKGGLTGGYYDYALAAPLMADVYGKEDFDILILGLATGTYASQCLEYFGHVTIEGVEIDRKITDLAEEYFDLPEEVDVTVDDGRAYLFSGKGKDKKYDVIMVDAYQDITIPFQMSTVEFFTLVKDHLKENGVMVLNMNMYSDEEGSINSYLADTSAVVFSEVCYARIEDNRELFASDNPEMLDVFASSLFSVQDRDLRNCLSGALNKFRQNGKYVGGDLILTDDKAPVELLGIRLIDNMIASELSYYREIFKEKGFKGLWDSLT
ncbi:MAG: fused MFS/spermidine synthase [Candidatus Borkfalkiaceae bacterium]|nr:fused MFS/spermidine synthase [Christensenellaceae bacterium]